MNNVLITLATPIAVLFTAGVTYLTYHESKRHTKHDEMLDIYDRIKQENDELRKQNAALQAENDKLRKKDKK